MKIAIVTDSSTCLLNKDVNKDDIYVLAIPYTINGTPYTDNQSYEDFVHEISDGKKFAKTSQVSLGVIEETYNKLLETYDYIIHLPLSSGLTSMVSTAIAVASKYNGRVKVIDQLKVATLLEKDVLYASRLAKEGKNVDEIIEALKERYNDEIAFIIPFNLSTLKQGGRINAATAAIGNLIGIKPIIQVKDGRLDQYGKERAMIKAYKTCLKGLLKVYDENKHDIYILHCNEEFRAKEFGQYVLKELPNASVKYGYIPVPILAHTGPGTLGIGIIDKD